MAHQNLLYIGPSAYSKPTKILKEGSPVQRHLCFISIKLSRVIDCLAVGDCYAVTGFIWSVQ